MNIKNILNDLENSFKPLSIFLYGSRAREDFSKTSDWEIGVLFPQKHYTARTEIKEIINQENVNVYPFVYEDFIKFKADTPFVEPIFFRDIISGGKTLRGKNVIGNMKPPKITVIDVLRDLRFNLGRAFGAMFSWRNQDKETASHSFYKSCLFGTRDLIILELNKFPIGFKNIYQNSKALDLGQYSQLPSIAYQIRQERKQLAEDNIFQNFSYLNDFIEPKTLGYFKNNGDKILL